MKIIGFNFNKISAQKSNNFKKGSISTNIEFVNVEKEKVDIKDIDLIKLSFKFSIFYKDSQEKNAKDLAELSFEGSMVLSTSKEESKQLLDSWKKKQIPDSMKLALMNLVIKKCSIKALSLEEDLNLPPHIPLPKLQSKK